jgi:hypothetical protein
MMNLLAACRLGARSRKLPAALNLQSAWGGLPDDDVFRGPRQTLLQSYILP